jgi:hypothetical protein
MSRLSDLKRFYNLLCELKRRVGGARELSDLSEYQGGL